jgi:hypothetical protein
VREGDIASGAWPRVLSALGLESTPRQGATIDLVGRNAEVLVSVDDFSLLLSFDDEATLLIDVEGDSLYTVSASYGEESPESADLLQRIAELAELACTAAGEGPAGAMAQNLNRSYAARTDCRDPIAHESTSPPFSGSGFAVRIRCPNPLLLS